MLKVNEPTKTDISAISYFKRYLLPLQKTILVDMAKYYIRTDKGATETSTIYFDIQKRMPKVKMRVSTHIKVNTKKWNDANQDVAKWNKFIQTEVGRNINDKLDLIQQAVSELFAQGKIQSNDDKPIIDRIIDAIVNADAIRIEEEQKQKRIEEEQKQRKNILSFYDAFIEGIKNGTIRHGNNKRYTKGSINAWTYFRKYLYDYCKDTATFDDVTKPFADQFVYYLEEQGFSTSACNKYIAFFRKLCNLSAEYGINTNGASLKVWKVRESNHTSKRTQVYLTNEELKALYEYPLQGKEEQVRDMFILGELSCQRYSDFSKFSKMNFAKTANGTPIIQLEQVKTKNYVEIPITSNIVMELCRKYSYNFPRIDIRIMNESIKRILYKVADVCPSLNTIYKTNLTLGEKRKEARLPILLEMESEGKELNNDDKRLLSQMKWYLTIHHNNGTPLYERNIKGEILKYKWELISTHTARRSGITNLYKAGILNTTEMMSISGHKTQDVFFKYIKVGTSEQADRIAEKLRIASQQKEQPTKEKSV